MRPQQHSGFTLVEVLAAIAILGVALFILLESQYTSLAVQTTINENVINRELIETIVSKAEVNVLLGTLTDTGDFGSRYPDYTWTYDAALRGNSEDTENRLYEVSVTIEGPSETKTIKFYTYDNNAEQDRGTLFENPQASRPGEGRRR